MAEMYDVMSHILLDMKSVEIATTIVVLAPPYTKKGTVSDTHT